MDQVDELSERLVTSPATLKNKIRMVVHVFYIANKPLLQL